MSNDLPSCLSPFVASAASISKRSVQAVSSLPPISLRAARCALDVDSLTGSAPAERGVARGAGEARVSASAGAAPPAIGDRSKPGIALGSRAGSRLAEGDDVSLGLDAACCSICADPIMEAALASWGRSLFASTMGAVDPRHKVTFERLALRGSLATCTCGWRRSASSKREAEHLAHDHRRIVRLQALITEGNSRNAGSGHHVTGGRTRYQCRCGWFVRDADELQALEDAASHVVQVVWSEADRAASAMLSVPSTTIVSRRGRRLRGIKAEAESKSA